MSIILNDNLDTQFNKPLDTRFGSYADIPTALAQVPLFRRYIGLTIGIGTNPVVEYWFNDGIQDADLVLKTPDIDYPVTSVNGQTGAVALDKTDIGLGNVDNTSDANKPISTATQTALNDRVLKSDFESHVEDFNNPHVVTKTQIGLGNVTNVDTTNASNISSGTLGDARLSANVTTQGNTFNAANKLVQLDASAKLPAVDGSQLTNLPSFTPPNGLLKIASAISTTFQAVTDYLGNASVLFLNSRRVGIGKDTSVTTQSVAVVEVQDANTSIVLKPNGTGAIIASVPDGTVTGGDARGIYTVDLQMSRTASNQVASSQYGFIGGGQNNRINGNFGAIVSGSGNTIPLGGSQYIFIGGGIGNQSSGYASSVLSGESNNSSGGRAIIAGGASNTNSSSYGTISGGQSNTASTNTHNTVVGGQGNTSSGVHSISGGNTNTASGESAVTLGRSNIASGQKGVSIGFNNNNSTPYGVSIGSDNTNTQSGGNFYGFAIGVSNIINNGARNFAFGDGNTNSSTGIRNTTIGYASTVSGTATNAMAINSGRSTADYNLSKGLHSIGYLWNSETRGGGVAYGGNQGYNQITTCIASNSTSLTTAATTILSLDGTGTTNLIIPNGNNRAWNVQIDTIAVVTAITGTATGVSVGDVYSEVKNLLFKRIGGTSSIVGSVDTSFIKSNSGMSTAAITITTGASQQMAITFTAPTFVGGGSVTCRVVSKVSLVECAY